MTKQTDLTLHTNTAIHGLIYASEQIDRALFGGTRHLNAQIAEQSGPFALAMRRLAAIAEGETIEDLETARADLLFTFPMLHHLGGGFYASMQEVLFSAHMRCADLITCAEAEEILGEYKGRLVLEAVLGHIHLIVRAEGEAWQGYDATYLGEPGSWYEVRYAGYEIRAVREKHDTLAEDRRRWKAEQQVTMQD